MHLRTPCIHHDRLLRPKDESRSISSPCLDLVLYQQRASWRHRTLAQEKPGKGDNPAQGMHASLTEAKIRPKGISPSPLILNGGGQKGVWMDGGRIQACKKIPPGNESNQGPRDPHSMCIVRMEQKRKEKYTHIRQREK